MRGAFAAASALAAWLVVGAAHAQTGPFVYVPNFGDGTLSVLDTSTNTVSAPAITVGASPATAAVRGDESVVYVTNNGSDTVSVINTATNAVVATIPVQSGPAAVAVSPNGATVYVTNFNSNTVSVINAATNAVTGTINVGANPYGVTFSPNGALAYVANNGSDTLSVINTATSAVIATIPVGTRPIDVAITPNGSTVYVANQFGNDVSVISTTTNSLVATIAIGANPYGVAVSPNGAQVFVTYGAVSGNVAVVNTATNAIVANFAVGVGPGGVSFSPDGSRVYVEDSGSAAVVVINAATDAIIQTIAVGTTPLLSGVCSNGNALLATGLTFKANTSGALACTLASGASGASGPIFAGGTLQFAGANIASALPITLLSAGGAFDTNGANATLSGGVSGVGGLTKIGLGTLTLSGAGVYSGATAVNAGALQAGAVNAFSANSAYTIAGGATLDLNGFNQTIGSLAGAGSVMLGAATLTTGADNTSTTFSGAISGSGGLTKIGSGVFTLSGPSSYSGASAIQAGALQAGAANVFSSSSAYTISSGAVLDLNGFNQAIGSLAGAGAVTLGSATLTTGADGKSTTFSGGLSGSGGLVKIGAGELTLNGANTYSGGTTLSAGALGVGNSSALGTGALSMAAGTTLQATAGGLTLANAIGLAGTDTIDTQANALALTGAVSGTGGLVKIGAGELTLAGANTYSGGTTLSAGALGVGNSSALGAGALSMAAGTTLRATADNLTLANTISLAGADTVNTQTNTLALTGAISGTGGLVKTGAGELTLAGSNTYSGGTTFSAGALGVGNSSALGAGALSMAAGTTLRATADNLTLANAIGLAGTDTIDTQANALTLAGVISGAGGLVKTGAGELALNGANAYSGGATLSAGALDVGNSSALGAGALSMAAGTTLRATAGGLTLANAIGLAGTDTIDTQANTLTLAGVISGTGGLVKSGAGELTLSGADTYSGGAVVSAGVLRIGAGGASGSILGDVVDNATLAFDRSDSVAFGGVISGTGAVQQLGSGELTLSAANSYSGGTLLSAGVLAIGDSAALGTGALTMRDGTVLQFAAPDLTLANAIVFPGVDPTIDTQGNNETISGVISGTGGLTKIGAGALDLTATSAYTGATVVSDGALIVEGSIASSSSLTLASGATLGGSGVVPSLVATAGATVAPGTQTPFSTLRVAGSVAFLSGSTYAVDVDAAGAGDKIVATGAAKLSGGTVDIVAATGGASFSTTTRYTILTASGGVTGVFSSLDAPPLATDLAFLAPALTYDANDVYFGFARTAPFASVAATANQAATAAAIQALGAGASIYGAVVGQTASGARQAFDALSGEIHASAASAAFDDTRLPREAVLDRLASPYGAPLAGGAAGFAATNPIAAPGLVADTLAAWGQAFGSWGHSGGDSNAASLDRSLGGFVLGLDGTFDGAYRLGVAAGYTQSSLSLDARSSSGHVDSTYVGAYGGAAFNALQWRGGAFYAYNRYGLDRSVAFPGFTDAESAGYGGDTLQAFAEAGWRMPLSGFAGPTFLEPIAGLTAMHIATAGFTESGGAAALTGGSQGYDYAATTLGARAEATLFSSVPLLARGMIGWRHVFGDVTPSSTLAFASAPSIPFAVSGAPVARDALAIEAGFDWKLTATASLGLFYSAELGNRDTDNAIKGKFEVSF